METSFAEWVNHELIARGWSQSEAARRGGISTSAIQQMVAGVTNPGTKLCRAIARAFDMPVDEIFQRAGLLPMPAEATLDDRRLLDDLRRRIERLSVADRRYLADLMGRLFPDG